MNKGPKVLSKDMKIWLNLKNNVLTMEHTTQVQQLFITSWCEYLHSHKVQSFFKVENSILLTDYSFQLPILSRTQLLNILM